MSLGCNHSPESASTGPSKYLKCSGLNSPEVVAVRVRTRKGVRYLTGFAEYPFLGFSRISSPRAFSNHLGSPFSSRQSAVRRPEQAAARTDCRKRLRITGILA